MDETAIMKAAVTKHVGDAAKDWTDKDISVSFATLKAADSFDPLRQGIIDNAAPGAVTNIANIRDAARAASNR
ncbi:hypothetical protein ACFSUK_28815 [Sphingobium scionense]